MSTKKSYISVNYDIILYGHSNVQAFRIDKPMKVNECLLIKQINRTKECSNQLKLLSKYREWGLNVD